MIFATQPKNLEPTLGMPAFEGYIDSLRDYFISPLAKSKVDHEAQRALLKLSNGITLLAKINSEDNLFQLYQLVGEHRLEVTNLVYEQTL